MCKAKVLKPHKKDTKQPKRAKHTLQRSNTQVFMKDDDRCTNFLEVCLLCTMIHFFRAGLFDSWDVDMAYQIYTACIDGLHALGIVLSPLRRWTKEFIWKKLQQLTKEFTT